MKPFHLCLATLICVTAVSADQPRVPQGGLTPEIVFRAQSGGVPLPPGVQPTPLSPSPIFAPQPAPVLPVPTVPFGSPGVLPMSATVPQTSAPLVPNNGLPSTWNAFSPPQQTFSDPFAPGGPAAAPYAPYTPYGGGNGAPYGLNSILPGAGGSFSTFGTNQPEPFRMGWQNQLELEWIPETGTDSGAAGNIEQYGVDYEGSFTGPLLPGWVVTWTNQFRHRGWDGPASNPGLPGRGFRFGWDLALETSLPGPVSWQFGVTPSINSDLDASLGSEAWQIDGRIIMLAQLNQYWSLMLGAAYWDRVSDRVIPHVGLLYRDDFWDVKLTFPEAEVALFLGNEAQWSKWMYVRGEYHVEAFQVSTGGGGRDEVELEDIRLLLGFRMKAPTYTWFLEGGWVFDREVDYRAAANRDFSPATGFIGRMGWKY